jgi:uncharacterized membrane protein
MTFKKPILLIMFALFVMASCKKSASPIPKPVVKRDTDVYLAGFISTSLSTIATFWKNGVATKLAGETQISSANAIAINGSDVYIAGAISNGNSSFPVATYWKNGVAVQLTDSLPNTSANAIAIKGNDIYIAGTMNDVATVWKNGVATRLDNGNYSAAYGIAVSGNDVYVAGFTYADPIIFSPTIWKNGVETRLDNGNISCVASSVSVIGNDVYVLGRSNNLATLWKNGIPTVFDDRTSQSESFAMTSNGADVYLVRSNVTGYWKNNKETIIPGYGFPYAITVVGSDVYVAGAIPDGSPAPYVCYWKNGSLVEFGSGGNALGIAVVPH